MAGSLSRRDKIIYGFGDIGFSLTSTILGAYFAIFLTDVMGVAPGSSAASGTEKNDRSAVGCIFQIRAG
jgi:Na+/melibiose symporter-like transporter